MNLDIPNKNRLSSQDKKTHTVYDIAIETIPDIIGRKGQLYR